MPAPVPFDLPTRALEGKVVVVTGASQGLGAGLCTRFAELGAAVGACARREPRPPSGAPSLTGAVDVTDAARLERFGEAVAQALGPVDLWVNNAGVLGPVGPQRLHDPGEVERALLVNVAGVANATRTFARLARGWPAARRVLVNVSSGAARTPYEGWAVYGATKAAVDQYTRTVAVEEPGLLCHAVAPGVVETAMQEQVRALDEATFPAVERFRRIRAEGRANSPAWVADHLAGILLGSLTPDEVLYRVPDEHP
ncbi:MAG: SDR family NAD(P)-dependent oxidoreductase [Actinobacteria bacterium]|nr:SDR family NAD(P)-dependent oxidoreductase [Actinomycetota bacterium]